MTETVAKWRMGPRLRKAVLVVHITATVALIGDVWALLLLGSQGAYESMVKIVYFGGIPLSMIALATGLLQAFGTPWRLLHYDWVMTKLVLLIFTVVMGIVLVDPVAVGADPTRAWMTTTGNVIQLVLLMTAVGLSVYKPRRLRPW